MWLSFQQGVNCSIAYRAVASLGFNSSSRALDTPQSTILPPRSWQPQNLAFVPRRPPTFQSRCSSRAPVQSFTPAAAAAAADPERVQKSSCADHTVRAGSFPVFTHPGGPVDASSSRARRARRGSMANSKFSDLHGFEKPNDKRALDLMDECAREVMNEFTDIRLAYGESDEYSFVLGRNTDMYGRRAAKLVSLLVSCFTANYVARWSAHLTDTPLRAMPMFDGRAVCYPLDSNLRDYLAWRQADTHINNQYNTCFWALVNSGKTPAEAQATLKGTQTAFKNEMLFQGFGINYAHLPEQFKKGSVIIRQRALVEVKRRDDGSPVMRERSVPTVLHVDIIRDEFWESNPQLLAP
ncbi:hypothetical protein Vafri_18462 [Volvox africanus]|uniref:tRNA(His) guanylyltransferase n=1 Tax=Volvox africanus TaxID=51714 RepID=A0A8J4BN98_9CHLO|nr:hypothetical protein Vafri_18462 [Volvox africanus]